MPRVFAGATLVPGIAIGPVVLHGTAVARCGCSPTIREAELARLHEASQRMQQGLDELIAGVPDGSGQRRGSVGVARGARSLPPGCGRRRAGCGAWPR